jgi:hypothetical protein
MPSGNGEKYPLPPSAHPQQKGKRRGGAGNSIVRQYTIVFLVVAILLFTGWQLFNYAENRPVHTPPSQTSIVPNRDESQEIRASKPSPWPTTHYERPNFEAGIVFPQWSADGYGLHWQQQLPTIHAQTGARWMEITVFLSQATDNATQVGTSPSTPSVQSFASGVSAARAEGYHVFVVPLMGVTTPADQWAGTIQFSNAADETQWFDSYWHTLQPYVLAAAQAGADQLAIGTELVWLQQNASTALWNTLIARLHSVFPGILTYDMNWPSLGQTLPTWLSNPQLAMIGVSEYIPLVNERIRVDPQQIPGLWKTRIKSALDSASINLKKPIIISEIGYRNTADTLYNSWVPYSTGSPPDPTEQAAACNAALVNVIPDPYIAGIFFWGWDDVGSFKLSGQPATSVLYNWYSSTQS